MSKPMVVTASNRSSGASGRRSPMAPRKLLKASCVTITPFGVPVEPDV